ncbi:putative GPI transamidase component Tta2 [Trypanosoma theileri]|uniref:Putative GPI transamidase component Tta2 n=1 Tax=Trypanosoma theileri TaxID=67003 RepID=A0A1X0P8I4_9TRYP|nr:putative GPI transamidase component Tta2 [Trypanosoma theileri]ORC93145.1 putative GPI transamidase component Tta2 [Trypanosoma theileri]
MGVVTEKILTAPLVAAFVTFAVRILMYNCMDYFSLPYHFGITTPNTGAEVWKEAVFWKHRFGAVPEFLGGIAPWYAEYIPVASSTMYVVILCLFDALTAFFVSQWPSAMPQITFSLFVLNPVMIFLPILESLAPVEHLLLTLVIECCLRRRKYPYLIYVARLVQPILGFSFIALIIALWFPVGTSSPRIGLVASLLGAFGVGGLGLLYLWYWGALSEKTSLYSPPDNGVMWYVRLLILPAFGRCVDVFEVQLPAVVTLPLALALPAEVPKSKGVQSSSIPGDRRLFLVLFAICVSKLCRSNLALSDYSLGVLFLYSLLEVSDKKSKKNGKISMFERMLGANVFVPVYTLLLVVPLQHSFYTGWVMWDTANPNWVFFPQVAFVIMGSIFLLTFLNVAVDAIQAETEVDTEKS